MKHIKPKGLPLSFSRTICFWSGHSTVRSPFGRRTATTSGPVPRPIASRCVRPLCRPCVAEVRHLLPRGVPPHAATTRRFGPSSPWNPSLSELANPFIIQNRVAATVQERTNRVQHSKTCETQMEAYATKGEHDHRWHPPRSLLDDAQELPTPPTSNTTCYDLCY